MSWLINFDLVFQCFGNFANSFAVVAEESRMGSLMLLIMFIIIILLF